MSSTRRDKRLSDAVSKLVSMKWTLLPWQLLLISMASELLAQASTPKLLIYTATAGYRHDSIPTAVEALKANASTINVAFDHTEDQTEFTTENLMSYAGIIFLSTTGEGKSSQAIKVKLEIKSTL